VCQEEKVTYSHSESRIQWNPYLLLIDLFEIMRLSQKAAFPAVGIWEQKEDAFAGMNRSWKSPFKRRITYETR